MSVGQAREARCAVEDCRRRMGGVLVVELPHVVELCVCREHGDAIDSGAPFGVRGVKVVMGDEPVAAALEQPQAVWQRI